MHGAVALYHSPFWSNVLEDQEGFFQFLMDIGVRMGNKRKHSADARAAVAVSRPLRRRRRNLYCQAQYPRNILRHRTLLKA